MEKSSRLAWIHGLAGGVIGGAAGAAESALALLVIDPASFNLNDKLGRTLLTVLTLGVLTGVKVGLAYLKQSPLPPKE